MLIWGAIRLSPAEVGRISTGVASGIPVISVVDSGVKVGSSVGVSVNVGSKVGVSVKVGSNVGVSVGRGSGVGVSVKVGMGVGGSGSGVVSCASVGARSNNSAMLTITPPHNFLINPLHALSPMK